MWRNVLAAHADPVAAKGDQAPVKGARGLHRRRQGLFLGEVITIGHDRGHRVQRALAAQAVDGVGAIRRRHPADDDRRGRAEIEAADQPAGLVAQGDDIAVGDVVEQGARRWPTRCGRLQSWRWRLPGLGMKSRCEPAPPRRPRDCGRSHQRPWHTSAGPTHWPRLQLTGAVYRSSTSQPLTRK